MRESSRDAPEIVFWETDSLDEHVALIKRQLQRSVRDPELRKLVLKIISGRADDYIEDPKTGQRIPIAVAWGEAFRLPLINACTMKDATCESQALWDFVVLNMRYVLDPDGADFFATAKYNLLANGGDCDDYVITLGAMHKLLGFSDVRARIVSTNGKRWEHIYLLVGLPKLNPTMLVPLDPTVKNVVPGWQYTRVSNFIDYKL